MPPPGDVIPPHGAVMSEFRIRTVSVATRGDLRFERTAEKTDLDALLACACASVRLLPAPVACARCLRFHAPVAWAGLRCPPRSMGVAAVWAVLGFSDLAEGLNLLPASAMSMALSWFPRVLFSSWVSMQS